MPCVAVTRGGVGDFWLFDDLIAADTHPIVQFGDALCQGPMFLRRLWQPIELVAMAQRLGDERLASAVKDAIASGPKRVAEYFDRLWNLLVSASKRPPTDPAEILRIVSDDRKKTRVDGVHLRLHPTEEGMEMTDATTGEATEAKKTKKTKVDGGEKKPTRVPRIPDTSVISFGKDKDGKNYGPDNNPKRPGSQSAARFALYKSGMTVKDALAAGLTRRDLESDSSDKQGYIKIS